MGPKRLFLMSTQLGDIFYRFLAHRLKKYMQTQLNPRNVGYEHEALDGKKTGVHYWENRQTSERHGFKFKDNEQ
jgi:hypothetical protein